MLPLCSVLLLCTAAAPPALRAVAAREITVGTRWPQLIAKSGKVFRNVKFTYVSPREVRFMHTDGIGSLPVGDLVMPDDVNMPVLAAAADAGMPPELTMGPLGSMMTAQERKISGIDKLSNDEQATLAKWVLGTVEDRLKVELERRGLPPTFAPLETVPVAGLDAAPGAGAAVAVGTVPAASVAGPAPALAPAAAASPAPAVTARANGALGAAALASKQPQLMAAAPGRTYVPPSTKAGSAAQSPLLPPPAPAEAPTAAAQPRPVSSSSALPTASPTQIARTIDPVGVSAVMAASKVAAAAPSSSSVRQPAAAGTRTGGRQVKGGFGLVESSIAGEFRGLEAGRQFRLINGQTWLQEEAFAQDHLAFKPRVTIYPAKDGWMMAVDGVNKAVRVQPMN